MESIQLLTPEIQKRISKFANILPQAGFKRPEIKFTISILTAMLKKHDVHLTVLTKSLGEKITPKKTWERLSRHLSKEGLGEKLIEANIRRNKSKIKRLPYCVIDGSDIQKPEATKMEGLCRVRDGSRKSADNKEIIGNGYHWLNGVMVSEDEMAPFYSDIYSLDYEGDNHVSENTKILDITDIIGKINSQAIFVIDRGGDRSNVMKPMLEAGKRFVVRAQSQRSVRLHRDSSKSTNIRKLAGRVKTMRPVKSMRNGELFDVGIRRIYLWGRSMWLVVSRRRKNRGALSWYYTNIEGSREVVMEKVMEAYGLRWRVEEYHRQVKTDYGLEGICFRKYSSIKNMGVILMISSAFCSLLPEGLVLKLLAVTGQLPRRRLSDIPSYRYYMITMAVSTVLEHSVKQRYRPLRLRKLDFYQFNLKLSTS